MHKKVQSCSLRTAKPIKEVSLLVKLYSVIETLQITCRLPAVQLAGYVFPN